MCERVCERVCESVLEGGKWCVRGCVSRGDDGVYPPPEGNRDERVCERGCERV